MIAGMIRRALIVVLAGVVLLAGAGVAASSGREPAPKQAHVATPAYVVGYWPEPQLCVLDQTFGLPVAAAAAAFDPTPVQLEVRDSCGDQNTIVVMLVDRPDATWGGWWDAPEGSSRRDDGLWSFAGTAWVQLNTAYDMTDREWQLLLVHELGHAVGLDHTSRRDTIMHPDFDFDAFDGLTATDLAVLEQLYSD